MSEVTIKIDDKLKNEADDLGLDFNTAINIFLRTSINTQSIPFKIEKTKQLDTNNEEDNFYNEENIKFLKEGYLELKYGLGHKRELLNENI